MTCLNRTCLEVGSDTPEVVTDLELRQLAESYQQHHFVVYICFACQLHDDPTTESGGQNHIRMSHTLLHLQPIPADSCEVHFDSCFAEVPEQ